MTKKLSWFPWNGSKRKILSEIEDIFSKRKNIGKYIEPFVGGGSVSHLFRQKYPQIKQIVGDANPWLISAYNAQLNDNIIVPEEQDITMEWITKQRKYNDSDISEMTTNQKAIRFAVCLFTAWGNRWETKNNGEFKSTVNKKYCEPSYLKKRLDKFFDVRWLKNEDVVLNNDWSKSLSFATDNDLVYIDSPYPDVLGYGNQSWRFSNHLDILFWMEENPHISIVISNMVDFERLYKRMGFNIKVIEGPKQSKTRTMRSEIIAWNF